MIFRKALFIGLSLILFSCVDNGGLEESIILYNQEKKELFINMLNEKNVNYRVQDDGQIFYPVVQKEIVIKAFESTTGRKLKDLEPAQ